MKRRIVSLSLAVLVFSLALAGCGSAESTAADTPVPSTDTIEPTSTATPTTPEESATDTSTPTVTSSPTSSPTPSPEPTQTVAERYGESVIWLMRAVNHRQEAFGLSQSDWQLGGTPDGGQDYPALDALDDCDDDALYDAIGDIQMAIYNIVGAGSGHWGIWNNGTDELHTFTTLYNQDGASWWLSEPEEGNLEEIRNVLLKMSTVATGPRSVETLFVQADINNQTGTLGELGAALINDDIMQANVQAPLLPEWYHWASQELVISDSGIPYHAQIARAYITFSLENFQYAPEVEDPVILRLHIVNVRNDKIVLPGFDTEPLVVNVSSGYCDPESQAGSGYCGSIQTLEQRQMMWVACGDDSDATAELDPVGDIDGYHEFELSQDVFTGGEWAQFKIQLEDEYLLDEMEQEPPGSWQSFGIDEDDNWLIFTFDFPEIPEMPSSFD